MQESRISAPVRNVGYATAIRYFWWGFAELLIPLFIFSFMHNYTDTGLLSAAYEVSAIISLPFIGYVADRWGAKKLLTVSLLLYPFLSFSYFLAGFMWLALFIVIARLINGLSYSLYHVGEKTVARTYASTAVSSNIWFVESLGNMLWVAAALIGVVWIKTTWIPLSYPLLMIAPTSLIGLYFIRKLPKEKIWLHPHSKVHHYKDIRTNIKNLPKKLKIYGLIYSTRSAFNSLLWLIIPLYIYIDTADIYLVVISGVIMTVPSLFAYQLWKIADKQSFSAVRWSFVMIGILFLSFIMIPWYAGKLIVLFILALLFVFLGLVIDNLSNRFIPPHECGRVEATFEIFASCGAIVWPILGGYFLDNYWITTMMLIIGIASLSVSIAYHHKKKYLQHS